jgi:hypothetical protein
VRKELPNGGANRWLIGSERAAVAYLDNAKMAKGEEASIATASEERGVVLVPHISDCQPMAGWSDWIVVRIGFPVLGH